MPDAIEGGAGRDIFVRPEPLAGDVMDGGAGSDHAELLTSADLTVSDDEITSASGTVAFTSFEVVFIRGSPGGEEIDARAFSGSLTVVARGGDDRVVGGPGQRHVANLLVGDAGDDVLIGGSGHDGLSGRTGDDVLIGRGGPDGLDDARGADRLSGGPGRDTFHGVQGRENVFRGGPGVDHLGNVRGSAALTDRSFVTGKTGARLRSIESVHLLNAGSLEPVRIDATGFSGNVSVVPDPGSGDDVILGGSGDDELFGGDGDDVISGGRGSDHVDGETGTDSCDGGPGRDEVVACE
jgi:Ca2+-binding RTX toxin-like protein